MLIKPPVSAFPLCAAPPDQALSPVCEGSGQARTATSGSLPSGGFALSHALLAGRAILEARHALAVCRRRRFTRFVVLRIRTGSA